MRKENDFFMFDNWADCDYDAPVYVLLDAGLSRNDTGSIMFWLTRYLHQVSDEGVSTIKSFRRWLSELGYSPEKIDLILSTSIFVSEGADKIRFTPFGRQAKAVESYKGKKEARRANSSAGGKASALVPNKGRFQKGNKAACKHKEEAVAAVVEEVKKEAEPEETAEAIEAVEPAVVMETQEEIEVQAEEAVMAEEAGQKVLEVPEVKGAADQRIRELVEKELAERNSENSRIAEFRRALSERVQAIPDDVQAESGTRLAAIEADRKTDEACLKEMVEEWDKEAEQAETEAKDEAAKKEAGDDWEPPKFAGYSSQKELATAIEALNLTEDNADPFW